MTKKPPDAMEAVQPLASQERPPAAGVPASRVDVDVWKTHELAGLLFMPPHIGQDERRARIRRALEQFESTTPKVESKGELAEQMVGTRAAALKCLRRAAQAQQPLADRKQTLKRARKLMALYTRQLAALSKHRRRGPQTVTGGASAIGADVVKTEAGIARPSSAPQARPEETTPARAATAKAAKRGRS